jgi:hypothetical protein
MVEYLRKVVSGKKNRYVDERYNLDLTYITPRIVAMAYPGSGITTFYRNDINDVADFLVKKHPNSYLVINLSGFQYDNSFFNNNVLEYSNQPLEIVITCVDYGDFLDQTLPFTLPHADRVVVVTSFEDDCTRTVCNKWFIFLAISSNI